MRLKHSQYFEQSRKEKIQAGYLEEKTFNFYRSVFQYQEKVQERYAGFDYSGVNFIDTKKAPMLQYDRLALPVENKEQLLDDLAGLTGLIEEYQDGLRFEHLLQRFGEDDAVIGLSLKHFLNNDSDNLQKTAESVKVDVVEFAFILNNWMKPFFIGLRKKEMHSLSPPEGENPRCPFCGYYPAMSKIVNARENLRILHCGFCECEWEYRRLMCPICGNDDAEKLGYYVYEDAEQYRIDFCDSCKGYIKAVRVPKGTDESDIDLAVESIVTNFLDSSAIEIGYSRP